MKKFFEKINWTRSILIGSVIIVVSTLGFFYVRENRDLLFPQSNTTPMYGFQSYDDYKANRGANQAKADDEFIYNIFNHPDFNDGIADDAASAGAFFIKEAFARFQARDYATGMKRLNQAWLIDPNNHNVYWGFAIWEDFHKKDCEMGKVYFNMALEKYDIKYETSASDKERLKKDQEYCIKNCP